MHYAWINEIFLCLQYVVVLQLFRCTVKLRNLCPQAILTAAFLVARSTEYQDNVSRLCLYE